MRIFCAVFLCVLAFSKTTKTEVRESVKKVRSFDEDCVGNKCSSVNKKKGLDDLDTSNGYSSKTVKVVKRGAGIFDDFIDKFNEALEGTKQIANTTFNKAKQFAEPGLEKVIDLSKSSYNTAMEFVQPRLEKVKDIFNPVTTESFDYTGKDGNKTAESDSSDF